MRDCPFPILDHFGLFLAPSVSSLPPWRRARGLIATSRIFASTRLSSIPSTFLSLGFKRVQSLLFQSRNYFQGQQAGDLQTPFIVKSLDSFTFTPFSPFRRSCSLPLLRFSMIPSEFFHLASHWRYDGPEQRTISSRDHRIPALHKLSQCFCAISRASSGDEVLRCVARQSCQSQISLTVPVLEELDLEIRLLTKNRRDLSGTYESLFLLRIQPAVLVTEDANDEVFTDRFHPGHR